MAIPNVRRLRSLGLNSASDSFGRRIGGVMMLAEATTWSQWAGCFGFGFMTAFVLMAYLWLREHPEDL